MNTNFHLNNLIQAKKLQEGKDLDDTGKLTSDD